MADWDDNPDYYLKDSEGKFLLLEIKKNLLLE